MAERPYYEADWEQPFPPEEYAARRTAVARKIGDMGFDAVLVTNPSDLNYLTGYDMIWFHLTALTSCLLSADAETVFFDNWGHQTIVETTPEIRDIRWLQDDSLDAALDTVVTESKARNLAGGKLAVQRWGYSPHADTMKRLTDMLNDAGIATGDASFAIQEVRFRKSPREIAVMREAARIADDAMVAARDMLKPGVMETEIEACIMANMMAAGGGDPGIRCMIGSGPRAGTHHSPAQHRRVGTGELVFIDFCSSLHRYHVNLNRTFAVGQVDPRWHDLMEKAAENIDHIVATVKPGDDWSAVQWAGDERTDANGIRDYVWYVGGYALGIAMPPDWVGDLWVKPKPPIEDRKLEPGMVFNFEGQFDDREGWAGGSGAAYIETFLVTEDDLEVLSTLPRTLAVV